MKHYLLIKLSEDAQFDKEFINMIEAVDGGGHKVIEIKNTNDDCPEPHICQRNK